MTPGSDGLADNNFFHLEGSGEIFVIFWPGVSEDSPYRAGIASRVGAFRGSGVELGAVQTDLADLAAPSDSIATGQTAYTDYVTYGPGTIVWVGGAAYATFPALVGAWVLVSGSWNAAGESIDGRYRIVGTQNIRGGDLLLELEQPFATSYNLDFARGAQFNARDESFTIDVYASIDFLTQPGAAVDGDRQLHLAWLETEEEDQNAWTVGTVIQLCYRVADVVA